MLVAPRTPESLRVLLIEFGIAIAFTYLGWRFNWHLRGMAGKEDGPLSKSTLWVIAVLTLGLFLFLAFLIGAQREEMGLPIF
ncbi:MAG TPA: hypothetical protein VN678_04960 [Acidobacteriaceae bacterium]|nr:hypothetical protein [Acidobacteriaceae bacterium]